MTTRIAHVNRHVPAAKVIPIACRAHELPSKLRGVHCFTRHPDPKRPLQNVARHQELWLSTPCPWMCHACEVVLERQLQEPLDFFPSLAEFLDDSGTQLVSGHGFVHAWGDHARGGERFTCHGSSNQSSEETTPIRRYPSQHEGRSRPRDGTVCGRALFWGCRHRCCHGLSCNQGCPCSNTGCSQSCSTRRHGSHKVAAAPLRQAHRKKPSSQQCPFR
mmetsp:Transcript_86960/g.218880  ORF Transcript_86960/g.218880 Transcript_86960/m.218880 type:complete len:218 (-) Transcript_86960:33-686(-)